MASSPAISTGRRAPASSREAAARAGPATAPAAAVPTTGRAMAGARAPAAESSSSTGPRGAAMAVCSRVAAIGPAAAPLSTARAAPFVTGASIATWSRNWWLA
ncbi:hypothetical protein ACFQY5_31735 [Paeniroseomonas aquatica]|uniref:hypothetical protein n=1 Tax=Paeniroseomonas aquatica TaxID=373043 RepID=UPI0036088DB7